MTISWTKNWSNSSVAHLIDMPSARASVVAESSGLAARTSIAAVAREVLRRPVALARADNQPRSSCQSSW